MNWPEFLRQRIVTELKGYDVYFHLAMSLWISISPSSGVDLDF